MLTDPNSGAGALRAARPDVRIDGRAQAALTDALVALRVHDAVDELPSCELTVGNWGPKDGRTTFQWFDRDVLEFGKQLQVSIAGTLLFDGRISALEAQFPEGGEPTLAVLAEDALQELRMTRRTRTFEDQTDADIARSIASDHGLTPDISLDGPSHKLVAQLNQSDLAFLRERARAVGGEVWVQDGTLVVKGRRDRTGGGRVTLGWGSTLHDMAISADLAGQISEAKVAGWDVSGKQAVLEMVNDGVVSPELGEAQDSGSSVLQEALGSRAEVYAGEVPLTSAEARARAQALFQRRARRFVCGRGVADADARLRVGGSVSLEGLGPLYTANTHLGHDTQGLGPRAGLRREIAVARPGLGRAQ
jgi:phage protein D